MLRGLLVGGLGLALSAPAEASWCAWGTGAAVAATHGARDWDLATPGTWVRSQSPALDLACGGDDRSLWVGVQATPTLWHSYDRLDGRYPMPVSYAMGTTFWAEGRASAGMLAGGSRAARGIGAFGVVPLPAWGDWEPRLHVRGLWFPGRDDAFQATLLLELGRLERESGDLMGARVDLVGPDLRLRQGFEVGGLVGYRVTVGLADADPEETSVVVGVRAGVLTDLRRELALRPVGLGTIAVHLGDSPIGAELGAGASMVEGAPVPASGLSLTLQGEEHPLHGRAGVLVMIGDRVSVAPDVGLGWTW